VWNRQRTDFDLVDPANTGLGHRQVQRWNLPEGWVISKQPAHPALISEAGFVTAEDTATPRGPGGPAARRYLLAGLLACGRCGRKLESAWSNGKPAYRCRHGYTSATRPDLARPKNTYVREDQILPHLARVGRGIPLVERRRPRRARSSHSRHAPRLERSDPEILLQRQPGPRSRASRHEHLGLGPEMDRLESSVAPTTELAPPPLA